MKGITTKKLVATALFMALTFVGTMFIRIPLPLGYVNLGDAFIFLAVFLLGPICGVVAGGVGAGLADLFGYITYAPGTLIIKSAMALLAWLVYQGVKTATRKVMLAEIIGGVAGTAVMAFGYFLYEIFRRHNLLRHLRSPRIAPLEWVGRHSLLLYMLHQPVIYGILWLLLG